MSKRCGQCHQTDSLKFTKSECEMICVNQLLTPNTFGGTWKTHPLTGHYGALEY